MLAGCIPLLLAPPATAATFVVDDIADLVDATPGDGTCATASTTCTLRAAIQEANAWAGPDVITLPAGTYALTRPGRSENAAATGDLDVASDITVEGECPATTVVDAGGLDRVLHVVSGGVLVLSRVTLQGGDVDGAFHWLPYGGGLLNEQGDVTLDRCRLTANQACDGGGLFVASLGTTRLTRCTIDDNESSISAGGVGRGILAPDGGPLELVNCTVTGNRAGGGGGGGLSAGSGPTLVRQSTIADNITDGGGGGVGGSGVRIGHSIVSGNTAGIAGTDACWGSIESLGHLLFDADPTAGGACFVTGDIASNVLGDPVLAVLADNGGATPTRALQPGSAAIDAGDAGPAGTGDAQCEPDDQRAAPRPFGPACDVGAFELDAVPEPCHVDRDVDGVSDTNDACPDSDLRATVFIGDCDTGATNVLDAAGCTLADRVRRCASDARNHGDFVSCIAHLRREAGTGATGMQRCAAATAPR